MRYHLFLSYQIVSDYELEVRDDEHIFLVTQQSRNFSCKGISLSTGEVEGK